MSITAAVTQYRQETIAAFSQKRSMLSMSTTKEFMSSGNTVTFLVAGDASQTAVTRGQNGDIPYNAATNNQVSATLVEKHAPYAITGFNAFASPGSQVDIMRTESMAVINREMDLRILAEMANATQDYGGGVVFSKLMANAAVGILGANHVPVEEMDNMFGVISPAAYAYMMGLAEFTSHDYVDLKPFGGPTRRFLRWNGVNWSVSSLVDVIGTSA